MKIYLLMALISVIAALAHYNAGYIHGEAREFRLAFRHLGQAARYAPGKIRTYRAFIKFLIHSLMRR